MTGYNYPAYQSHKTEIMRFINELVLKKVFETEGATLPPVMQVQRKTIDWLIDHISKIDKQMGHFIQQGK